MDAEKLGGWILTDGLVMANGTWKDESLGAATSSIHLDINA